METQVQTQASACRICGEKSGTGKGFYPNTLVFLVTTIPLMFHVHITFIYPRSCIIIAIESVINNTLKKQKSVVKDQWINK
jgi:hypothetical protein